MLVATGTEFARFLDSRERRATMVAIVVPPAVEPNPPAEVADQLDPGAIRRRIADRLTAILAPIALALVAIEIPLLLAIGDHEQFPRLIPDLVAAVVLPIALLLRARGRPLVAAGLLLAAGAAAIATGMLLNGGVRAPVAMLSLILVAAVCTLFGLRASIVVGVLTVAWFAIIRAAQDQGLLPGREATSLGVFVVTTAGHLAIFIGLTVIPQRITAEALRERDAQRRAAERARAQEQERELEFRAVFEQTAHPIGLLDPDGRILQANAAALAVAGMPRAEVLGQTFPSLSGWSAEARPRLEDAIRRAAAGERVSLQTSHVATDGRETILDLRVGPFRDEQGHIRYLIPEANDVTELVETRDRLHHAQKLEAIGQLAGGVAHDFNNLLAAILGASQLLRQQIDDRAQPDRLREALDVIDAAGARASDLIAKLLAFGRKQRIECRPLAFHACVTAVVAILERTLPDAIHIDQDLAAEDPVVEGDAGAIENALLNLALNARDAMPEGGRLCFRTRVVDLSADHCAHSDFAIAPGRYLRCSVIDTGSGIDADVRERIFEPFFTTKPVGQGTGLGLPAVFGTVVRHGGAIVIESAPGRGTAFHLDFPLLQAAARADSVDDQSATAVPPRTS